MSDERAVKVGKIDLDFGLKRTCTVAFNTCTSPTLLDPVPVRYGDTVMKPSEIERINCELVGWYVDRNLKKAYDFDTPVVEDIVLYAKWKFVPPQHMVSFCDYQDTTDVMADHGQPVKRPPDPIRRGYNFLGWYIIDVPEEVYYYIFDTPVVQSLTMWAMWEEQGRPALDPVRPISPKV